MATRPPSLARALTTALRSAPPAPRDAAAVALAKRYAGLIDEAAALADALAKVRPEDESDVRQLASLRARVDAHAVASDLGPKLLAALAALALTTSARAGTAKGGDGGDVRSAADDALARLRAKRATRSD